MSLIDYNFIEIGTSDFEAICQESKEAEIGLAVEPLADYLNRLPDKPNVKKVNCAISDTAGKMNIYYVPLDIIAKHNFPNWVRGCNSINAPHPTVVKLIKESGLDPEELTSIAEVDVITYGQLMIRYNVRTVGYLKLDTEGHDTVILESMIEYCDANGNDACYPETIKFETNVLTDAHKIDNIINKLYARKYKLVYRGHDDTMLVRVC